MFDVRRHLGQEDSTDPPSGDRAAWAEAVCSGALDGLAWGLAAPVAVTVDPPGAGTVLDASVLARLEAEFATWKQDVESSDAVPALIEANAAAWASVEAQELSFSDLDAAREAVLCIGLDGLSLAEVAARAGIEVGELRGMLDDLPERVRRSIVSAIPGEVLGPLADAGSYRVVKLVSKASPEAADPAVLARARALAVARAIERVSAAKITWHDRL
ncbi:MAG TPA: hypothetical protein VG186_12255 [Solirubrobacteraceae bacterium]|nr:hypothetical protein [Solirubrobacteraceae bacterium]